MTGFCAVPTMRVGRFVRSAAKIEVSSGLARLCSTQVSVRTESHVWVCRWKRRWDLPVSHAGPWPLWGRRAITRAEKVPSSNRNAGESLEPGGAMHLVRRQLWLWKAMWQVLRTHPGCTGTLQGGLGSRLRCCFRGGLGEDAQSTTRWWPESRCTFGLRKGTYQELRLRVLSEWS